MKFGIDFTQPSTIRGGIWLIFCLAALYAFIVQRDLAAGSAILAAAGTIAGGAGVIIKDKET